MIAPTFEPGAQPGQTSLVAQQQETANQSWMDRAQMRRQREADIQHEVDMRPTVALKAEADRVSYHATIANAQILQEERRQAAAAAPELLAEFLDITKNPDLDAKAAALDAFAAKSAWLGNIPQNKGFLDAVNDARGKAHMDAIAMGKIAQAKEASKMKADTGEAQIEQRAKAAELKAATDIQLKSKDEEIKRMQKEYDAERSGASDASRERIAAKKLSGDGMTLDDALAKAKERSAANPEYRFTPKERSASEGGGYSLEAKQAGEEMTTGERNRQQRIADSSVELIRKAKVAYQMLAKNGGATGLSGEFNEKVGSTLGLASSQNATRDVLRALQVAYESHIKNFAQGGLGSANSLAKTMVKENTPEVGWGQEWQGRGLEKLQGLISTLMLEGKGAADRVGKKSMFTLTLPEVVSLRNAGIISNEAARGWIDWKQPPVEELDAAIAAKKGK